MAINGNGITFKEKRIKERRANENRRASVRFGDELGRRHGKDRRVSIYIKSE